MPEDKQNAPESGVDAPTDGVKDEPQAPQQPTEPTPLDDLKSFMESHDLKSPDDFSDFVQNLGRTEEWKQKYGNSQNEVGELRRQVEELSNALNQQQYQQQQYYDPNYERPTQNPLTKEDIATTVQSVLGQMQQEQHQAQMKYMQERNDIMRRPGWQYVQPHFDKALMDPNVQFALQNGTLTQDKLYNTINERVLLSKFNSVVETMPQGPGNQPPAATPETGDRTQLPPTQEQSRQQQVRKAVRDKNPDDLLKAILPDDDPIFR